MTLGPDTAALAPARTGWPGGGAGRCRKPAAEADGAPRASGAQRKQILPVPLDPEALARWRAMMLESAHVHESAALIVRLVDLCGRIEVPDLAPAVATGRQVVHAWPRRLSRRQAAAYCGLSPPAFDKRVARGTLPPGSRSGVTQPPAWWLEDLDAALTAWKADCLQAQTEREIRDG